MDSGMEKFPAGFADDARARLSAEFLNPARCLQWFLERYYPDGYVCPDCGAPVSDLALPGFLALKRFTCSGCGKQPRATHGTVLQGSTFSPTELFLLSLLISFGVDDREIARILSISVTTATTWRDKLAAVAEAGH